MILKDFGATAIACTPSYALYLAEELKTAGLTTDDLMLKTGIFGAEPWTEEMRREIEDRLKIEAFDIYGLSEISGRASRWNANRTVASTCTRTFSIPKLSIRTR